MDKQIATMLAEMKGLGIKDENLSPLIHSLRPEDEILSVFADVVFTKDWIVSNSSGPVRRDDRDFISANREERSAAGAIHAVTHAAKHPSLLGVVMAGLEVALHQAHEDTYEVCVCHPYEGLKYVLKKGVKKSDLDSARSMVVKAGFSKHHFMVFPESQ